MKDCPADWIEPVDRIWPLGEAEPVDRLKTQFLGLGKNPYGSLREHIWGKTLKNCNDSGIAFETAPRIV